MRVLNAAQMREADRITTDDIGIGSLVLMECAGRQVVATLEDRVEDLAQSRIAVLCGPGNNGGDGFVVARTLVQRGVDIVVFLLGSVAEVTGEARTNLEILGRIGLTVVEITSAQGQAMTSRTSALYSDWVQVQSISHGVRRATPSAITNTVGV